MMTEVTISSVTASRKRSRQPAPSDTGTQGTEIRNAIRNKLFAV
jgi:hypothetical protein